MGVGAGGAEGGSLPGSKLEKGARSKPASQDLGPAHPQEAGRCCSPLGAGLELPLRESYLIEVGHILAVLQDPGVEGLPWVGKRRV